MKMNNQTAVWWMTLVLLVIGGLFVENGYNVLGGSILAFAFYTGIINLFNSNE